MRTVLPNTVRLHVVRKGRKATFVYEETCGNARLVKRTVDIANACSPADLGIKYTAQGKILRAEGCVDYSVLANFMTGEFLMWSTIGEMKLRDVLVSSFVRGKK